MGLDIRAYCGLKEVRLRSANEPSSAGGMVCFYFEPHFPGREEGLKEWMWYTYCDTMHFAAGSYGGYNRWREELAALLGTTPGKIWDNPQPGPFMELINFADNEGCFGPVVSAKLAKDFVDWQDRANAQSNKIEHQFFMQYYNLWRKAFEMASNCGAVKFC